MVSKIEFKLEIPMIKELDNLELLAYRKKVKDFLAVLRDAIPRVKSELGIVDDILKKRLKDLEMRESRAKDDRVNDVQEAMWVN